MVFFLFSDYPKSAVGENGDFPEGIGFYCYFLMENFSLINSHNLLENPLLFPTEITNLLFVIKTRQPLKQNFMLNCKKTVVKKKELL